MEMKLSGTHIKELRLKLSWSQEKLAEEAGLNPRTVQRAEAEGSASLRTRLLLAKALQVLPEELDAIELLEQPPAESSLRAILTARVSGASVYYLIVLAVVSLIYLAFQPAFLSLSVTNYSWINGQLGQPWYRIGSWWAFTFGFWLVLSVPGLLYLYKRHRTLFVPYLLAFCAGLALAFFRVPGEGWDKSWREVAVATLLTGLVSVSGLVLLLSLYIRRINTSTVRHSVYMCLSPYVFVWFFQSIVFHCAVMYFRASRVGFEPESAAFLLNVAQRSIGNLVQLIPLMLVLVLSLGRKEHGGATTSPTMIKTTATACKPVEFDQQRSLGQRPRLRWLSLPSQAISKPPITQ